MKQNQVSIKTIGRIGGALYLVIILAGMFGEVFVRQKIIVSGDAAATAYNIANAQSLWRMGIAADLLMHLCDLPVMLVIYILLKPVNRNLALLVLLFNIVQTAVLVANKLTLIAALLPLGNAAYLKALDPHQIQAQVYLSLSLHDYGFAIGLLFFGVVCLVEGYLIFRSVYLPKPIGVLMQIGGVCYLVNSFALLLAPAVAAKLFPAIMLPVFIAELSFALWLLLKGVNRMKWEERMAAQRAAIREVN